MRNATVAVDDTTSSNPLPFCCQVLRQAVKNDPRDFRTVRLYGELLQRLGFAREAKEQLNRTDQLEGVGGAKSAVSASTADTRDRMRFQGQ